jgi:hypothetical protein
MPRAAPVRVRAGERTSRPRRAFAAVTAAAAITAALVAALVAAITVAGSPSPAAGAQAPPTTELPTDFLVDELTPGRTDDGTPVLHLSVDNTGGRMVDLRGELELLDGPGGAAAGPFQLAVTSLAPEQRATVEVVLGPSLPRGPWRASVTLTGGEVERRAVALIGFPHLGMGDPVPTERPQERTPLLPVLAGLLLGLLAVLVVVVAWKQRERAGSSPVVAAPAGRPRDAAAGGRPAPLVLPGERQDAGPCTRSDVSGPDTAAIADAKRRASGGWTSHQREPWSGRRSSTSTVVGAGAAPWSRMRRPGGTSARPTHQRRNPDQGSQAESATSSGSTSRTSPSSSTGTLR